MIRTGLNRTGREGLAWLFLLILAGCDPGNDLTFSTDEKYFPLQVGNYWIYEVSETKITLNISEEADYQIKIITTDSFSNVEGKYSYILTRFRRNTGNDPWVSLDTWVARRNDKELIVTQENVPYVKLSFPIVGGKEWNANRYNNEETGISCPDIFNTCDLFNYGEKGASFQTSGGLTFSNTAEVIENDAADLLIKSISEKHDTHLT